MLRAYAGGLVGNGCVGDVFSPGTSDCGTGRSSIGHTGCPVTRSKTNTNVCFVGWTTALIFLPLTVTSARNGGDPMSQSHTSWWTVWKCHTRFPVFTSIHTRLSEKRLLPIRLPQ